ncbi:NUDIX hydrolase [Ancylobacter sp. GSK1Z-4-2]|nr:NUDIX hydrolase [Ancylobacter mangrovi]
MQILLVSSRETHRAVIPKGWPMRNRKDWKSAQIEARQEAGIVGDISRKRIGQYLYWKRLDTHFALVKVSVFPLAVRRQLGDWPERHERERRWMTPEDAALLVDETDLGALITEFAQSQTWRKLLPSRPVRREGEQLSPAGA